MSLGPRVRLLNWLGDRSWVSDQAWWRVYDVDLAIERAWRCNRAPDLRVWLDVRPALALWLSRRASRITRELHVRTDPTCELGAHVPRSRALDLVSRGYACPACTSRRHRREVLEQLRTFTGRLYEQTMQPLAGEELRQHAQDVVERYRRDHDQ